MQGHFPLDVEDVAGGLADKERWTLIGCWKVGGKGGAYGCDVVHGLCFVGSQGFGARKLHLERRLLAGIILGSFFCAGEGRQERGNPE